MNENEMGYRGSKSKFKLKLDPQPKINLNFVKEQRVDGNWCKGKYNPMHLRCTLMGFERNYPIKILSSQLNRFFSTFICNDLLQKQLNPSFVTGLTDGEGCFTTSLYKNNKLTTG
jgi:hypothetical protein